MKSVIVDSGFLVGLFNETDPCIATRTAVREVLTVDKRDFAVYRTGPHARFIDVLTEQR